MGGIWSYLFYIVGVTLLIYLFVDYQVSNRRFKKFIAESEMLLKELKEKSKKNEK